MNLRTLLVCTIAPLALAACTEGKPAQRPAVAPAAKQVGEPVSCIQLSRINETRVRDDWTIDFIDSGRRAWRNTLTSRCSGLKINNAITYQTSLAQLCSTDIVYVLEQTGGSPSRGPACGLGQFVPVELER